MEEEIAGRLTELEQVKAELFLESENVNNRDKIIQEKVGTIENLKLRMSELEETARVRPPSAPLCCVRLPPLLPLSID